MKIKVLFDGPYIKPNLHDIQEAKAGDIVEVPDWNGADLIARKLAEPVKKTIQEKVRELTHPDEGEKPAEETHAAQPPAETPQQKKTPAKK